MSSPTAGSGSLLLVVVGKGDALLYDSRLTGQSRSRSREDVALTAPEQFQCLAALDPAEMIIWTNPQMYCKVVDKLGKSCVSLFCGANHTKILLLHRQLKNEEGIRHFLMEVNELIIKIQLSPFYDYNGSLYSAALDKRVNALATKYLL